MSSPSVPTIKRLFAVSGNNCAFPKCPLPLVDADSGKVTGRICHIKARSEGGARYDANQTDEEKHGFDNLILMCPIHHDVIDSDEVSFTVERLHQIKAEHEKAYQGGNEPSDELAQQLIDISFIVNNSVATSHNQSGGQIANQIINYAQQNVAANEWEIEIQKRRHSHDLAIFERANEIFREDHLRIFSGRLYGNHEYRQVEYEPLENFYIFAIRSENQYINSQINEKYNLLASNIRELTEF